MRLFSLWKSADLRPLTRVVILLLLPLTATGCDRKSDRTLSPGPVSPTAPSFSHDETLSDDAAKEEYLHDGTIQAGNTIYEVFVEDIPRFGPGQYTIRTGPDHPVTLETGSPQNLLYGGASGNPGTSFVTIRSYSSGTDYIQRASAVSDFAVVSLDPYRTPGVGLTVEEIGSTGVRTTYHLDGDSPIADVLEIVEEVNVRGTVFDDSSVEITTSVTNTGTADVAIGIRYFWDFQIGMDDGPTFAPRSPDESEYVTERDFASPSFSHYRIRDNDFDDPSTPLFEVYGTVTGPAGISPSPVAPDNVQHVAWPNAQGNAFDYTPDPTLVISTTTGDVSPFVGGDDAVNYFWGRDETSALLLAPGETVTVSQSLFGSLPDEPPAVIENQAPEADAGGPYTGVEGSPVVFDGTGSFDPDGDALTYAWTFGDGNAGTGHSPDHTYLDDGSYDVALQVSDPDGAGDSDLTNATVQNVAPAVHDLTGPDHPVEVGTSVMIQGTFSDPGVLDTHTVAIDWEDGNVTSGDVTETAGSGTFSGSHKYDDPGVYPVQVTVTDDDGGSGDGTFEYVVVFDPDAGFVTGGGWISSPAGAYPSDPTVTGRANFGFVSRYRKGQSTPSGHTEFVFQTAELAFHSSDYDWLVVNQGGANAQFKGRGRLNGEDGYRFMLWAGDGTGTDGEDTFRIKIWEETDDELLIYDNGMDQPISGGSVKVHAK